MVPQNEVCKVSFLRLDDIGGCSALISSITFFVLPWQSKELKDRLAKLQDLADQKAYAELVKDVTKHQHDDNQEYFSSYKDSLGFGK